MRRGNFGVNLVHMKSGRRPYVMTARAEATQQTAARAVDEFTALFLERPFAQITLREVAERAGMSVQTLIRHFGDKDGLTAAAATRGAAQVAGQRAEAVAGDLDSIVDNILDHYAAHGRTALRLLAEEDSAPAIAAVAQQGRELHRAWCERVFTPFLVGLTPRDRERRVAQLVAVCDVYTWQLLHHRAGLEGDQLRLALLELLTPLTVAVHDLTRSL